MVMFMALGPAGGTSVSVMELTSWLWVLFKLGPMAVGFVWTVTESFLTKEDLPPRFTVAFLASGGFRAFIRLPNMPLEGGPFPFLLSIFEYSDYIELPSIEFLFLLSSEVIRTSISKVSLS